MERDTVRRCQRCKEPAVIVVNRWESRLFGVLPMAHSGQTDHQCQACGARFSLRPQLLIWFALGALWGVPLVGLGLLSPVGALIAFSTQGVPELIAVLVLGAAGLGLGLASLVYNSGPQIHAWRNPIVPGAEMPQLRLGPPEGARRCRCGVPSPRIRQQAYMAIRFPAGTSATHLCPSCGREFTVPDRWALVATTAMTLFLGGTMACLAALLPFEDLRADHFFVLGLLGLGALIGGGLVAFGITQRGAHPTV